MSIWVTKRFLLNTQNHLTLHVIHIVLVILFDAMLVLDYSVSNPPGICTKREPPSNETQMTNLFETDLYVILLNDNYWWLTPLTMEPAGNIILLPIQTRIELVLTHSTEAKKLNFLLSYSLLQYMFKESIIEISSLAWVQFSFKSLFLTQLTLI